MSPAQALVETDYVRDAEPTKKFFPHRVHSTSELNNDPHLTCENNCEDDAFYLDPFSDQKHLEYAGDCDVVTDVSDKDVGIIQEEDPDATECSSSFEGTGSDSEGGLTLPSSDVEVESHFPCKNPLSSMHQGSIFPSRKKRLTAHWRRYIRPLMWRCKWIELRVKELQSQAQKYDKELSEYAEMKKLRNAEIALVGSVARSVPLMRQRKRNQIMKRRKRRKIEETVDVSSYIYRHSIFGYCDNKRFEVDNISVDDECGHQVMPADLKNNNSEDFGVNCDWPQLQSTNVSSSLEQILWSIDLLQNRVEMLKIHLDKAVSTNFNFSSAENPSNFVPSDLPSSSIRSPSISPADQHPVPYGGFYIPPVRFSEYEVGDLVMPDSAVSSFVDVTLPDVIESTAGLLSAASRSLNQLHNADSCEDAGVDVLIHNQAMKDELQGFEKVVPAVQKPQELTEEHDVLDTCVKEGKELDPSQDVLFPEVGPTPRAVPDRSILRPWLTSEGGILKHKRKRGKRRAGLSHWNHGKVYKRRSSR